MVCEAAKPLRGRSPGPMPKRSEAWDQVNDLAKEKKNRLQGGAAGHTINVLKGMNYVIIAPAGSGRGQRAVRPGTSRSLRRDVNGRARAGEGVGVGTMVAQVLKVLMVCLLYLCPRREREGAASV